MHKRHIPRVRTRVRSARGESCRHVSEVRTWGRCLWTRTAQAADTSRRVRTPAPLQAHRHPRFLHHLLGPFRRSRSLGCCVYAPLTVSSNRCPPRTPKWCTPAALLPDIHTTDFRWRLRIHPRPVETTFWPSRNFLSICSGNKNTG